MQKASFKTGVFSLLLAVLLVLASVETASAQRKTYRSSNNPFIEMMMSMMDAMGMLDRIPSYGAYGNPYTSRYGNNLYGRGLYGNNLYGQGLYGNSPLGRSPWMQSPWSRYGGLYQGGVAESPLWGSPDWGVIPAERFARYGYSPYIYSGDGLSTDYRGWVVDPWEQSKWNEQEEDARRDARMAAEIEKLKQELIAELRAEQQAESSASAEQQETVPLVQNFNYLTPEGRSQLLPDGPQQPVKQHPVKQHPVKQQPGKKQGSRQQQRSPQMERMAPSAGQSPLAKLVRPRAENRGSGIRPGMNPPSSSGPAMQKQRPMNTYQSPPPGSPARPSPLAKKHQQRQPSYDDDPCITAFCGLKKPDVNGLWVAENGEMLGIKNYRYLWTDGKSRYLTGQIKIENEYLVTNVDDYDKVIRFKYKLAGNNLITMSPSGVIREFIRTPTYRY